MPRRAAFRFIAPGVFTNSGKLISGFYQWGQRFLRVLPEQRRIVLIAIQIDPKRGTLGTRTGEA